MKSKDRTWMAGYGLQDADTDMDRRTWIAGQGLQDMDTDMNCRTWIRNSQGKEFKSHRYIHSLEAYAEKKQSTW